MVELSKLNKSLNEIDDLLEEMANLEQEDTGIKGYVWISTKEKGGGHKQGPRVKYYINNPGTSPSFSVNIHTGEITQDSLKDEVSGKIRNQVIEFVRKNQAKLLDFWNNGTSWGKKKYVEFLNSWEAV